MWGYFHVLNQPYCYLDADIQTIQCRIYHRLFNKGFGLSLDVIRASVTGSDILSSTVGKLPEVL